MQPTLNGTKVVGVTLVLAGRGYNKEYRASYNRYRVLVLLDGTSNPLPIESICTKEQLKKLPYWSARSDVMAMTCWGTSQQFEAQLALAGLFGMREKGEEWGTYTRRVTNLIQSI